MAPSQEFGPYEEVLSVISRLPNAQKGLNPYDVRKQLRLTPGLFFSPGTTWDEILTRMVSWGWLAEESGKLYVQGKT